MVKCVFCGKEEREFKGIHMFKNDGSISYFCSSKCRKNSINLGRDKRKIKWTESYGISLAKIRDKAKREEESKNAPKPVVEKKSKPKKSK